MIQSFITISSRLGGDRGRVERVRKLEAVEYYTMVSYALKQITVTQ